MGAKREPITEPWCFAIILIWVGLSKVIVAKEEGQSHWYCVHRIFNSEQGRTASRKQPLEFPLEFSLGWLYRQDGRQGRRQAGNQVFQPSVNLHTFLALSLWCFLFPMLIQPFYPLPCRPRCAHLLMCPHAHTHWVQVCTIMGRVQYHRDYIMGPNGGGV